MNIAVVTNRRLCKGDFFEQLKKIAAEKPDMIILREKDLSLDEYTDLALRAKEAVGHVPLICNTYYEIVEKVGAKGCHLPLPLAERVGKQGAFMGISVHSVEDALKAKELGADYITYGHVFETDCKKGLPPRGLTDLEKIIGFVDIPVYAIGGIKSSNVNQVEKLGAHGVCIMSSAMMGEPKKVFEELRG